MDLSTSYTIKAQVKGQNQISGLEKGLDKLKTSSNNAAGAMNKLKGAASQAFGALKALAPAIGVVGMGKLVNDTLTLGDELGKLAEQTHIPAETLDKLRQAANLAGVDFKKVSKSFGIFAENMMDFTNDKGIAYDALERLKINPEFINERGVKQLKEIDELFFEVAEGLNNVINASDRIEIARSIFGGQGMKLIPLLNMGKEGIMGLDSAFSDDFADRIEAFNDSMAELGEKFNFLKFSLVEALLPALELAVDLFSKVGEALKGLPKPVQSFLLAAGLLAPAVLTLVPILAGLIFSFKTIAAIKLGAMFTAVVPAIAGLATAFAPFLAGGAIVLALIGIGKLIGTVAGHIWAARDQIGEVMKSIGKILMWPFVELPIKVAEVLTNVVGRIKEAFNAIPNFVKSAINAATAPIRAFISFIKRALALLNKFRKRRKNNKNNENNGTPPGLAAGGVVSSPQLIYAGEAGSEYVVPARKAAQFSKNYLSGMRGSAAIPRFAEGGYITRPNVNITTGAVTQMDGTNFITTNDLSSAVQSGIDQTLNLLQSDLLTRRSLGLT